jgi:enediyne biosynthesis protein E4
MPTSSAHFGRWLLAVLTLLALAALGWFILRPWLTTEEDETVHAYFRDEAAEAGLDFLMAFLPGEQGEEFKINLYDHGAGVAVGDYDGDGHDDIYFANQLGPNALYRNQGDGTFENVTDHAGVAVGDRVCVAAAFADYDNDGDQDLFVTSTRGGNILFQNQGDGTFKDVTKQAGVELVAHSQTAAFFDYDNDGWLDLLVVNTARWTTESFNPKGSYYIGKGAGGDFQELVHSPKEHNRLYRNNRDGTFTDVTVPTGMQGRGWAGDVALLDYNDDGHLDVLITCMFGPAQLYRNNSGATFTDVTDHVLGRTTWGGVGAKAFGSRNNGRLDLLIVDMHSDMWMGLDYEHKTLELARQNAGKRYPSPDGPYEKKRSEADWEAMLGVRRRDVHFGNTFFRNLGGEKFEECAEKVGLETFWPWGIAAGDFDNDGHEDLFLTAGMGYPFYYWPNALLMNNGDGAFTDRAQQFGIEPPVRGVTLPEKIGGKDAVRSSRCAAVADFDGDGRLEIVVNNFNHEPYYFRNQLPARNYVAFRLQGVESNRDAVGAVVRLFSGDEVLTRQVHPAGGYLAQSSRTLHFGLGDRKGIERAEITWPGGRRQSIDNVTMNQLNVIVEKK